MVDSNEAASRAGALATPLLATIDMKLLSDQGGEMQFELIAAPPVQIIPAAQGVPPKISFKGIRRPIDVLMRVVDAGSARFLAEPDDAAWFGPGTAPPTGKGTAGGMFKPRSVSSDGRELLFRAANVGDGQEYRARFNLEKQSTQTTALHGGPIIIND